MLHLKHHDSDSIQAIVGGQCQSLGMVLIVTKPIWVDALVAAWMQVERRNDQ
jgi:hypothetical protein